MTREYMRKLKNFTALLLCSFAAALGLFWLLFILYDVFVHGIGGLHISLFINDPAPPGIEGGGLRDAFVGQLIITFFATFIGVPIGVLGATFLAEYARGKKLARLISVLSDIMVSVPSIVVGAFVYAILVKPFGHFSGWAGAVALAIIMIPVVLRTTEDMLSLVPWTLREAAFALGAPYREFSLFPAQQFIRGSEPGGIAETKRLVYRGKVFFLLFKVGHKGDIL